MAAPNVLEWAEHYGPVRLRRNLMLGRHLIPQAAQRARQRLLRRQQDGPGPLDGDAEAEFLVELWAMGILPAHLVQQIAERSALVAPRPQISLLAAMGSEGRYPGNCTQQLRTYLRMNENAFSTAVACQGYDVEPYVAST